MRPSNDGHGHSPLHGAAKPALDLTFNPEERKGLTTAQAEELQRTVGFNELPVIKVSKLMLFLTQFTGTMPYMLELAAVISAACTDWADLGIILTMLICNGCLGFREELECLHSLVSFPPSFLLSSPPLLLSSSSPSHSSPSHPAPTPTPLFPAGGADAKDGV